MSLQSKYIVKIMDTVRNLHIKINDLDFLCVYDGWPKSDGHPVIRGQ